ncbi:hypothetical protein [Croceimicrobium sp.]|uniref:hypothetical protein n=1 Tax=Croceimicrobium sp. TaxID=2828340 RepID=UPI003BAB2A5F
MPDIFILKPIGKQKKRDNDNLSDIHFPYGLVQVERFSINLIGTTLSHAPRKVIKGYVIELHHYPGFAMIKYYPRMCKNDPKKYQLRSKELGYQLSYISLRCILKQSASLIKIYLDDNPDSIIGYVGQPDNYDDRSKVDVRTAQRARVYNRYVLSMFQSHKYAFPEDKLFRDLNLNFIRKVHKHERQLTTKQRVNYLNMKTNLTAHEKELFNFMTSATKKQYE